VVWQGGEVAGTPPRLRVAGEQWVVLKARVNRDGGKGEQGGR
jgi:hypothetical protein